MRIKEKFFVYFFDIEEVIVRFKNKVLSSSQMFQNLTLSNILKGNLILFPTFLSFDSISKLVRKR